MNVPERLERHLETALQITSGGALSKIEVFHATGDGAERLATLTPSDFADAGSLAERIFAQCTDDATSRAGWQRYAVVCFRAGSEENESQCSFTVRGAVRSTGIGGDSDPPTPSGFMAVALRSMVDSNRLMAVMAESTSGQLAKQLLDSERRRETLENRMVDHTLIVQQLLDRQAQRDLEMAEARQRAMRSDQLWGGVVALVPLLASGFFEGRGQLPVARTLRDKAIGNFLATLDGNQFEALGSMLRPDQAATFVELLQSYKREQERERAATPAPLREEPRS